MIGRSLVGRLSLLTQAVIVLAVLAFATSAILLTARFLLRQEQMLLYSTARDVAANVDNEFDEAGTLQKAASDVLDKESTNELRIAVVNGAGEPLASTGRQPGLSGHISNLATGWSSPIPGIDAYTTRSNRGAWVQVSIPARIRRDSLRALIRSLLLAALPVLLIALYLGRRLTRRALRPLSTMAELAASVATPEGIRSLGPASGLEEIDELGAAFEHLLARLQERLGAEKRFTSDASHELRTPLTILSGELELALADPRLTPEMRPGLWRAFIQVRAMKELVDALLLMRRVGAGDPSGAAAFEPVNLSDVAEEVAEEVVAQYPDRSDDLHMTAPDEVLVPGQPALLHAAVRNLLDNALKFTTRGQPVRLTVADGSPASVTVEDGGAGIAAEDRDRVFDPFFRGAEARATREGFGLGLPILIQIARAHLGEVEVEQSPLGGARFVLRIPAWAGSPARTGEVPPRVRLATSTINQ